MAPAVDAILQPLTVLVPEGPLGPVQVFDEQTAIAAVIVSRSHLKALGAEWDQPGVYLLLDRHDEGGKWGVYVGKAPSGLRQRVSSHARTKDHWSRALLIRRDNTFGFNSAQVGWLEGRIYDLLNEAPDARLVNQNRPGDTTLPAHDQRMLERIVGPVASILHLLDYEVLVKKEKRSKRSAARDQVMSSPAAAVKRRHVGVALAEVVESGILPAGSPLISTNKQWPAEAVITHDGCIEYDGHRFRSTSTAAKAAKQGHKANGWEHWAVPQPVGEPKRLIVYRDEYLESLGRVD